MGSHVEIVFKGKQLKLLGATDCLVPTDIDMMIATFRHLSDEIRRIIPDILAATMTLLHNKYKLIKSDSKISTITNDAQVNWKNMSANSVKADGGKESYLSGIRDKARALITYAGMVPYRM